MKTLNLLNSTSIGRIFTHAICAVRHPSHFIWHWCGIQRELLLAAKPVLVRFALLGLAVLAELGVIAQPASFASISFQAALIGADGQALPNGNYTLGFRFWDGPASGAIAVSTNILLANVPVANGVASTAIPVDLAWFNGQTRYLGISVNGAPEMTPRVLVTTVPYAALAGVANQLGMGDSTSIGIAQMISQGGTPGHRLDVRGELFIGDWQPNTHPALVLRGAHSPVGRDGTWQDIRFDFSGDDMPNNNAGSARIRAWRGGSWDTYLEFMVNRPDEGHDRPTTIMRIDSGSVDFLKGINAREGLAVTGDVSVSGKLYGRPAGEGGHYELATTSINVHGKIHTLGDTGAACENGRVPVASENNLMTGLAVSNLFVKNIISWDGNSVCVPGGSALQTIGSNPALAGGASPDSNGLTLTVSEIRSLRDKFEKALAERDAEITELKNLTASLGKRVAELDEAVRVSVRLY